MQDWLAQARSTRSLQHQDTLQKQKVDYSLQGEGFWVLNDKTTDLEPSPLCPVGLNLYKSAVSCIQ